MGHNEIRKKISELINSVEPYDNVEQKHKADAVDWIKSGVEIFRIEKHAKPEKHLVSYSILVDQDRNKLLLLDHKKSGLLLPSGGHIEKNEMPYHAAKRELLEELNIVSENLFSDKEVPFL